MKAVVIFLYCLAACSPDHYETKGRIIERKALPDSQLLIRYTYQVAGAVQTDSMMIRNAVLNDDSVTVIYSPGTPGKSRLKLE